ncbi:MAG TPA: MFS transporter [Streptosporangiales bacterium]
MRDTSARTMHEYAQRLTEPGRPGTPAHPTGRRPRRRRRSGRAAPAGRRRWLALALLCVSGFMVILDAQIVTVAVPSIERGLHLSAGAVQWVLTAYVIAFGGLLLLGGRACDVTGGRRLFLAGIGAFAAASLACGLAPSGALLVVARTVQGVGAAAMMPAAMALTVALFPAGPERNRALGISGAMAGLGGTAGALVGGPITAGLGWQWIFFLNVPVGALIVVLGLFLLPADGPRPARPPLDTAGAVTATGAVGLFVYAVATAPERGWTSATTLAATGGAVLLAALFVVVEARSAAPLVPLRIFASRPLTAGALVALCAGMGAFGQGFVLTQYGQQVLGWSPVRFGLLTVALPAAAAVGSIVAQRLVTRLGYRSVAVVSMVLLAAGCVSWTSLTAHGTYLTGMLPGLLVFGVGLGAGTVAAVIAMVSGVAERDSGLASGLDNAAFQVGGALGVAVLATVSVSYVHATAAGTAATTAALTGGYRAAFVVATGFAVLGLAAALALPRRRAAQHDAAAAPSRVDELSTVTNRGR